MSRCGHDPGRLLRSHRRTVVGATWVVQDEHAEMGHKIGKRHKKSEGECCVCFVHSRRFVATAVTMKVVVLCSGGMDSVATLYWARREHSVSAVVSFDYGAKHNHREIPFAAEHANKFGVRHEIVKLDFV